MDNALRIREMWNFLNGKRLVRDENIRASDAVNIIESLKKPDSWFSNGPIGFRLTGKGYGFSAAVEISQSLAEYFVSQLFGDKTDEIVRRQVYANNKMDRFSYLNIPDPKNQRYGIVLSFEQGPERIATDFLGCVRSLSLTNDDLIQGIDMEGVDRNGKAFEYIKQTPRQALEHLTSDSMAPIKMIGERLIGARIFLNDFVGRIHTTHISLSGNGSYPARVEMKYVTKFDGGFIRINLQK